MVWYWAQRLSSGLVFVPEEGCPRGEKWPVRSISLKAAQQQPACRPCHTSSAADMSQRYFKPKAKPSQHSKLSHSQHHVAGCMLEHVIGHCNRDGQHGSGAVGWSVNRGYVPGCIPQTWETAIGGRSLCNLRSAVSSSRAAMLPTGSPTTMSQRFHSSSCSWPGDCTMAAAAHLSPRPASSSAPSC